MDTQATPKDWHLCNIPLISPAAAIIAKYAEDEEVQNRGAIPPKISNQKQNAYLKEIATICGIKKKLSTHVARYACATVVMLTIMLSLFII